MSNNQISGGPCGFHTDERITYQQQVRLAVKRAEKALDDLGNARKVGERWEEAYNELTRATVAAGCKVTHHGGNEYTVDIIKAQTCPVCAGKRDILYCQKYEPYLNESTYKLERYDIYRTCHRCDGKGLVTL